MIGYSINCKEFYKYIFIGRLYLKLLDIRPIDILVSLMFVLPVLSARGI